MDTIERRIDEWRGRLSLAGHLSAERLAELETHLRDSMDELKNRGLDEEEAFIVAIRRVGNLDELAGEFARAGSDGEWRRMALEAGPSGIRERRIDFVIAVMCALLSAALAKLPELFGFAFISDESASVWLRNAALFCLPGAALSLAWVRWRRAILAACGSSVNSLSKLSFSWLWGLALGLCVIALALGFYINMIPWRDGGQTEFLTAIHLPFFLWLVLLPLFAGARWLRAEKGMDFIRFSGESFIYAVLLLCGVATLSAFTMIVFGGAGFDVEDFVQRWILLPGVFAAPVAALRIALAKRGVVETIAPVLARLFAPLFLLAMLAFIVLAAFSGSNPFAGRDSLIAFDLSLAIVFALILFSTAMRDPRASPGLTDWVDFLLAVSALVIDALVLAAMADRLGTWGITPNRLAAIGENLILMVGLAGMAFFIGRRLFIGKDYAVVFRWQTAFLPVIFVWCGIVALLFPAFFGGR